jgi:hypothetical protein
MVIPKHRARKRAEGLCAIKKDLCAIKKVETRGHNLGRMFITATVVPRERDPLRSAKQACKTSTRSRGFLLRARRERPCDGP